MGSLIIRCRSKSTPAPANASSLSAEHKAGLCVFELGLVAQFLLFLLLTLDFDYFNISIILIQFEFRHSLT